MPWDFLVVANPVWETARLVERVPDEPDFRAHLDTPAEGEAGDSVVADGGGSALNTACALAMAGRRVLAVGRVGDDPPGRACLEALRRRGVETACELLPERTTKRNLCFVERETHATAFAVELPARSVPPWEETPDALLEARVLLLDRLAAAAPAWLRARTRASGRQRNEAFGPVHHGGDRIEEAERDAAVRDATGRHEAAINAFVRNSAILSPAGQARFAAALPHLDYLQVPEDAGMEAAPGTVQTEGPPAGGDQSLPSGDRTLPSGYRALPSDDRTLLPPVSPKEPAPDEARPVRGQIHRPRAMPPLSHGEVAALLAAGVHVVVRTRGSRGVVVHAAKRAVELSAEPTEVIDPTGAGDAFAAGILDALLDGLTPAESARRGLDWAARACRYLGARGWLDHVPPC